MSLNLHLILETRCNHTRVRQPLQPPADSWRAVHRRISRCDPDIPRFFACNHSGGRDCSCFCGLTLSVASGNLPQLPKLGEVFTYAPATPTPPQWTGRYRIGRCPNLHRLEYQAQCRSVPNYHLSKWNQMSRMRST